MIIVWSGLGWLTPLIAAASFLMFSFFSTFGFDRADNNGGVLADHPWQLAAALFFAGAMTAAFGLFVNRPTEKLYIDPMTGRQFRRRHSFFFIRAEYWGAVIIAAAAVSLLK